MYFNYMSYYTSNYNYTSNNTNYKIIKIPLTGSKFINFKLDNNKKLHKLTREEISNSVSKDLKDMSKEIALMIITSLDDKRTITFNLIRNYIYNKLLKLIIDKIDLMKDSYNLNYINYNQNEI